MIPRILHQTWKNADVPPRLHEFRDSWRRHHPSWEFRFWTDAENELLIAEHFPEFVGYFRSATPAILRVDLVRLAYLHRFGGVYADLDYEALRPLDGLLQTDHVILGREHDGVGQVMRGSDFIINALIASPPAHPLWLEVMRAMVTAYRPRHMLETHTGHVIRMAIAILDACASRRATTHGDVTVLPYRDLYPSAPTERVAAHRRLDGFACSAFGIHHYDNSWRTPLDRLVNRGRAIIQRVARTPHRSNGRPSGSSQSSGGKAR